MRYWFIDSFVVIACHSYVLPIGQPLAFSDDSICIEVNLSEDDADRWFRVLREVLREVLSMKFALFLLVDVVKYFAGQPQVVDSISLAQD